ncbi:MAG: hypothetical protein KGI55_01470, partial [Gammaproteobacteria bacterium]|nr:hypothetical protein [Gammaproteobacteria bacterium]
MASRFIRFLAVLLLASAAHAGAAPFDLAGPKLDVDITRGAETLTISQVPNLLAGDILRIKAELPKSQSAHYLLIVAFLSGSTNPPPSDWFTRCNTWTRRCARNGLTVTVPQDAQQVLVFLAPQTNGDFKTLVGAVRGRPGAFVRTAQDLNQATLDRSRLDKYLATIRALNDADPTRLKVVAPLLARSLAIIVDPKCLDRLPDLQAPCLMAGQESLILQDGHSTSIVEALTSGPASDLAMQASYTPQLSFGYYSPYFASVLDIARIFDSFRTAQYQYIPALGTQRGDHLALTLNTPPSFYNPKSVLVAALPAVQGAQLPPLHAVNPKEIYCARKSSLVLPVEGAPLVFSTAYARDMKLTLTGTNGRSVDLPARADAASGGFVIDTAALGSTDLGDNVRGLLHGYWGFDRYSGPAFELINSRSQSWQVAPDDAGALIVGRSDAVHLRAGSVSCIDRIMLEDPHGKDLKVDWKAVKPGEVTLNLPLQDVQPGAVTLLVHEYGAKDPQPLRLQAFSAAGRFDGFTLHAGDAVGILRGSRLDEVAGLSIDGVQFAPKDWSTGKDGETLMLAAMNPQSAGALAPARKAAAKISLKDGRTFTLASAVLPSRPRVALLATNVQPSSADLASNVQLTDPGELPQDGVLVFSVRALTQADFGRDSAIEVGAADGAFTTVLNVDNGGLTLETSRVAVANISPVKAFGPAVFGPLQFRMISGGVTGDWQPLATVVRLPHLRALECPATSDLACKLSGTDLFLVESIAADAGFHSQVVVPDGFPGTLLPAPHPTDESLYLKLRDDPS